MKPHWLVSVPVWGQPYTETFLRVGLKALEQAAANEKVDLSLVIYSDNPEAIRAATSLPLIVQPLPTVEGPFNVMSECHRDTLLNVGKLDDRICLLTADLAISDNLISHGEQIFASGKRLIAVGSVRGLLDFARLPADFNARRLLEWVWLHQHPMTVESIFPGGCNQDVSRMFFAKGDSVVTRQALPHPLVLWHDGRRPQFTPTIDANLIQNFHEHEVYVCTTPDEIAVVELSPVDKDFHRVNSIATRIEHQQVVIVNPMQLYLVRHRIGIKGPVVDCGDDAAIAEVESYSYLRYPLYRDPSQRRPLR